MEKRRLKYIVLISFLVLAFTVSISRAVISPPFGALPSYNLKAGFVFFDDNKIILPYTLKYDGGGTLSVSAFPKKMIIAYFQVKQVGDQEEGTLLVKVKRTYKSKVTKERRKKVKIWFGKGFYIKEGGKWVKKLKREEDIFKLSTYIAYSESKPADSVRKYLSVYWGKDDKQILTKDNLKEYLPFLDEEKLDKSLFYCGFIHFSKFSGVSWLPAEIPIADEPNNLEEIFIETVVFKGNVISAHHQYWLKEF
jgi:hypothetical protein